MSLIRFEPFRDVERLFESFLPMAPKAGWDLAADVYEDEGNLVVEMILPGIDSSKLEITVEDNHLRIAGTREASKETKDKNFYVREIRRGTFERTVQLPAHVDQEQAEASYKDGVLKITLPKNQERKITIPIREHAQIGAN